MLYKVEVDGRTSTSCSIFGILISGSDTLARGFVQIHSQYSIPKCPFGSQILVPKHTSRVPVLLESKRSRATTQLAATTKLAAAIQLAAQELTGTKLAAAVQLATAIQLAAATQLSATTQFDAKRVTATT
jgi:hypothetical protein